MYIPPLDVTLAMSAVYRKVTFEAPSENTTTATDEADLVGESSPHPKSLVC